MIQAVTDKIVVEVMAATKTKGGLVLPSNARLPQAYGRVISHGNDVDSNIKEGVILVFFPQAGMDMVIEDKILKVLKNEEVYGILKNTGIEETLSVLTIGKPEESIVKPVSNIISS